MALRKRGKYRYGDGPADLRAEIARYSREVGYLAQHFADCACTCGGTVFVLLLDDDEGVAVRRCAAGCGAGPHPIADSAEFLDDADPQECACPCGGGSFGVSLGVALYAESDDVKWLYVGCRCVACGLVAVYGDWKCEAGGYREVLARA